MTLKNGDCGGNERRNCKASLAITGTTCATSARRQERLRIHFDYRETSKFGGLHIWRPQMSLSFSFSAAHSESDKREMKVGAQFCAVGGEEPLSHIILTGRVISGHGEFEIRSGYGPRQVIQLIYPNSTQFSRPYLLCWNLGKVRIWVGFLVTTWTEFQCTVRQNLSPNQLSGPKENLSLRFTINGNGEKVGRRRRIRRASALT